MFKAGIAIAAIFAFGKTPAFANDDAQLTFAHYVCAALAERAEDSDNREAHLEFGTVFGTSFLEATGTGKPNDVPSSHVPGSILEVMDGKSIEFTLGRVFEGARQSVQKRLNSDSADEAVRLAGLLLAELEMIDNNCSLLRRP